MTPTYPQDAACAHSDMPAGTWDEFVAGETPTQRQARYSAAVAICGTCPVATDCYNRRDEGGGIRDSVILPDRIPGYSGNDWIGLDPWRTVGHGSVRGYAIHRGRGEDPCGYCYDAMSEHNRAREARRAARAARAA